MSLECDRLYRAALERLAAGRLQEAARACQALGTRFPSFADGWYISSILAEQLGNPAKALEFIGRALDLEAGNRLFAVRKASVLLALSRRKEAAALIRTADMGGSDPHLSAALAAYYTAVGQHGQALRHYKIVGRLKPDDVQNMFNLAATERFLGNIVGAQAAYSQALARDPGNHEAFYLRSGLRRQTPEENHIAQLQSRLAAVPEADWVGRSYLYYALAKELEDLGQYESSFGALTQGAALRRANMTYDVTDDVEAIDAIIDTYTSATLARLTGAGHDSTRPIFVLGLPRTGTTLVERILGSHTAVHAAGELHNFAGEMSRALLPRFRGKRPSKVELITESRALDFSELGERYIDSTRHDTGGKAFVVDKMPLNYLYCGLILAALPNAKIVEVIRHPLDTCYAIYKQMFTSAYPFSYDFNDLAEYYIAYVRLMKHWHAVLPGKIYRISYENLIYDQIGQTRGLLDFCDLSFEENCLEFEKNEDSCTTASSVQVRQKIYPSSIGRWKAYSSYLEPLRERIASSEAFQAAGTGYII